MLVGFLVVPLVRVFMGAMFAGMLVLMRVRIPRVCVLMVVFVAVLMAVLMRMFVGMGRAPVNMLMSVRMFMLVAVSVMVFVLAFHFVLSPFSFI